MVKEAFDLLGEAFVDGIDAADAICQHLAENAEYVVHTSQREWHHSTAVMDIFKQVLIHMQRG
jgi:hypothetical protein